MSLDSIIKNIDVSKVTAPTGLTFGQELVNAANLLCDCIQERIDVESMKGCINASDLADITVNEDSMTIAVNIKPDLHPSIFNGTNGKVANIFWLLNDGFLVRKDWYFDNFPKKKNWVIHVAKNFVEKGIKDFEGKVKLPIAVKLIERPELYYWE